VHLMELRELEIPEQLQIIVYDAVSVEELGRFSLPIP
jgi:hypothetical protein